MNNKLFPTLKILGVNIAAINMDVLIDFFINNKKQLKGKYVCVANVHTTVISYENEIYRKIQNNSLITIPDGGPLSTIGKRKGFLDMERITGPDLMRKVFEISKDNEYTHYFYGSTNDTLNKMKESLLKDYPWLKIEGMYSPPFVSIENLNKIDETELLSSIKADFIWVGLGAPKQEIWMSNHVNHFDGLMIGVGAGFDYLANNIKRAPIWMQNHNLEWLYRLLQEPKKLFKRYFIYNLKFLYYFFRSSSK